MTEADADAPVRTTGRSAEAHAFREGQVAAVVQQMASEGGYEAVQMRAVARRAGVALATLYRYYPSKDDLIRAAIGSQVQLLRDDVLARPPVQATPGERAGAVFLRAFHALTRDRGYAHALMSRFYTPRPFESEPSPPSIEEQRTFVDIAALGAWGPDHATTDDEYAVLYALESLFNSSIVGWLDGNLTAEHVEQRLALAAEKLLVDL